MNMNRKFAFHRRLIVLSLACLAQPIFGQTLNSPTVLNLRSAIELGLKSNPQVAAGLAGVASVRATYQALRFPAPIVMTGSRFQGTSSAPSLSGDTQDTIVDLTGTFDLSGQRRNQTASAEANFQSASYQFQESVIALEQQIQDAYWTACASRAQFQIAEVSLKEAQRVHDLTAIQEQAGTSPKGDVLRASIDVANAKQAVLAAETAYTSAKLALNTVLAQPATREFTLADDLMSEDTRLPAIGPASLNSLLEEAEQNRPLVKASAQQVKATNYAIRQTEASRLPDLSVQYQRSLRDQVDAVGLSLSFPILDFGGVSHLVRAAKENRNQAEANLASAKLQIRQQVHQAFADLQNAIKAASSYREDIVVPSEKLLEIARLGYQQGATGILPVIDAESTVRNARIGFVTSLLALYRAKDELDAALGRSSYRLGSK